MTTATMLATIVASFRAKLARDVLAGHGAAETGERFISQMVADGIPSTVAIEIIRMAIAT